MVYLGWEFVSLLLIKARINKKQATIFLFFILWFILAIRSINMGINDTSGIYYSIFLKCQNLSLLESLQENLFINEPLMTVITWLSSRLLINYQLYLALVSAISILGIYYFVTKNTVKPIHGAIVFFALFYFYEFFLIKQMLALSFVLYAFSSLKKRELLKYIVYICLAGLIHKSAFILIPVYLLCKYTKFNKWFFVTVIIGFLVGAFGGEYILQVLYKFTFYNFQSYIINGIYGTNGKINFGMFLYVFLTFFCYFCLRKNKNSEINDYLILMFVGCVLNAWSTVVVEFYRIALYFLVVLCALVPEAIQNIPRKYRNIVTIMIIGLLCLYALRTASNCNCLPYHTFLADL